jgi:hypothetical protein
MPARRENEHGSAVGGYPSMAVVAVSDPPGGDISRRHGDDLADPLARRDFRAGGAPAVVRRWHGRRARQWPARMGGSLSLGWPHPGRFRATPQHVDSSTGNHIACAHNRRSIATAR